MKARIRNKFSKPYFVVWEFFQRVLKNIFVELEVYQFNSREHIFKIFYKLVFVVSFSFLYFKCPYQFVWFFFSIKFISVYSIIYFIFILLIWYNNFIINIKLLIKSDVDSNFKFQFNQIFPHLSCSSFYIFLSLSLFLALNLFVLYYLLEFFYIFEYYCLICVLHIIISVNLLLPITSTNFYKN